MSNHIAMPCGRWARLIEFTIQYFDRVRAIITLGVSHRKSTSNNVNTNDNAYIVKGVLNGTDEVCPSNHMARTSSNFNMLRCRNDLVS